MRNKARSLLIGLLVLAFVATTVNSEPRSGWPWPAGPSGGDFLDWVRAMAGGGPIPTRIEPSATVALPRHQVVPTGKATGPVTRVRELVELRTATTRFFQLSDGRVQAEVSADAAYYRDGQGHYQPIDTRVGATDDAGFRYANQTNTFASRFGGRSDALAVLDVAGHKLTMGVPGTSRDVAVTATGDTVRFPDAVAGADLSYQVTGTALRERLVLGRAPADPTFTFVVDAGGLAVDARPDGSVAFRAPDGDGTPLLALPRPVLYDNRDDPSSPYGKAWSDRATQTVHRDGDRLTVTVTADRGWLADPARAYPVTIDPTFEVGPALVRSQDATIGSGTPGANHANASHLPVGGTGSGAWRGLTRFDLSGVPAGTHLDSASLQLYHDGDLGTGDTAIEARQVSAAWDPATVAWGSVNARAGDPGVNRETVDDADAAKTAADGEWPQSVNEDHLRYGTGGGYTYHKNPAAGQTFSWVPRITEDGDYLVEAHHVAGPDRSPVAPYTVFFKGGQKTVTAHPSPGTGPAQRGVGRRTGVPTSSSTGCTAGTRRSSPRPRRPSSRRYRRAPRPTPTPASRRVRPTGRRTRTWSRSGCATAPCCPPCPRPSSCPGSAGWCRSSPGTPRRIRHSPATNPTLHTTRSTGSRCSRSRVASPVRRGACCDSAICRPYPPVRG